MKKTKFLIILIAVIVTLSSVLGLCACSTSKDYTITVDTSKSLIIEAGDTVDYKQYFTVTDKNGNQIMVTDEMIDTSKANTSLPGIFTVTLNIGNASQDLTFTVAPKGSGHTGTGTGTGNNGDELSTVLAKYTDITKWNFAVTYQEVENGTVGYYDYYEYLGKNIKYTYDRYDDNDNYLGEATDYLGYNETQKAYYLYYDNLNNTYSSYKQGTTQFNNNYYLYDIDITTLGDYTFTKSGNVYSAAKPNDVGNTVIGEFTGYTWTKFTIQISNGNISQIDATMSDGYVLRFVFSNHGSVSFTLPKVDSSSSGTTTTPTGTMEKQTYNASTFDYTRLQQKLITTGDYPDPATGLPSTGTYNALVVPVQIGNNTISDDDLTRLNLAFNDTEGLTGWESVKSYYQKASYGELNLSFDIAGYGDMKSVGYYKAKQSVSYYETHTATEDGQTYNDGDNVILHEVLNHYKDSLDLSKYDTNNDGTIDAVYLIYSAPVQYTDDSFYWAYVTWNYTETKYDNKDAFYYLFAGFDFMDESVKGGFTNESYPVINGLKINAATYIHETGHLLGLDDYYDYDASSGCNEGLGGADMMDLTIGDQNVYSKTMLDWLTPTVVNSTQTVTIQSSQAKGDAILIPLDFNNSYFCEYLLIDLYSAQGLNVLHKSSLYDGAAYGVRIYHVSAAVNDPFNNDFGSFTDNNNSMSDISLIKLVEADGETKFNSSDGEAAQSDLWQAGDKLSTAFPKYTTNAGKLLIFDITIVSVSATQATITITYNS